MNPLIQQISKNIFQLNTIRTKPYSRLILSGDNAGWSLDWDMRELSKIAHKIGITVVDSKWKDSLVPQSIFIASQFFLLDDKWLSTKHRIGFSYFHGLPNSGVPEFDNVYKSLCKHHDQISRIQASHIQMRDVILQTGIDPKKVFLIPIGIDTVYFPFRTKESQKHFRNKLNIPQSAFVVGSFQKDGNGWDEGLEPKLIKGPDVFLSSIKRLKEQIPELYVLLSGPARGFIKAGLEEMKVPYSHFFLESYPQIGELFQSLDLYLVTSRQEGGPKAILESMASGVPIISTRVGQATDLINQGQNGWLADVEDWQTIAETAKNVYQMDDKSLSTILANGRTTAEMNSYDAIIPLWGDFFDGFIT